MFLVYFFLYFCEVSLSNKSTIPYFNGDALLLSFFNQNGPAIKEVVVGLLLGDGSLTFSNPCRAAVLGTLMLDFLMVNLLFMPHISIMSTRL